MSFDPTKPMNEPLTARIEKYLKRGPSDHLELGRARDLLREALQALKEVERGKKTRVNAVAEAAWSVLNHDNDPWSGKKDDTHNWNVLRDKILTVLDRH